jgi:predicted metalloprotease
MRWEDERQSDNVDDLRGDGGGGGGFGGGLGGLGGLLGLLPLLGLRGGIGVLVVIAIVIFGGPLLNALTGSGSAPPASQSGPGFQGPPPAASGQTGASQDVDLRFVRAVAAYTEDTWTQVFQAQGRTYTPPRIEIYSQGHATGCGYGQSAMGPFYCPRDRKVWLDLAFFQELSGRFGAPGRFAEAYVIAHEVGHHVQTLLGVTQKVDAQREGLSRSEANPLSVRVELQADCYAGVWTAATNRSKAFLEPGDIDEGLRAAAAVGDDTLQQETQGRVVPDSFTHGTSAQRVRWFRKGYDGGALDACDTFGPAYTDL